MRKLPDIDTKEGLWPDEAAGPFLVRLHYAWIGDRVECVGVELRSVLLPEDARRRGTLANMRHSPGLVTWSDGQRRAKGDYIVQPTPLTPDLFKTFPFGRIATATLEQSSLFDEWFHRGPAAELKRRLRQLRLDWSRKRRKADRGAPGRRPEHWYGVAVQLLRHPSDPLEALRKWAQATYPDEFPADGGDPTDSTLYRWINKAREDYGDMLKEATR